MSYIRPCVVHIQDGSVQQPPDSAQADAHTYVHILMLPPQVLLCMRAICLFVHCAPEGVPSTEADDYGPHTHMHSHKFNTRTRDRNTMKTHV